MEERKFRLIREEPVLGLRLKARTPIILPKNLYDWATDWVHDVGAYMRTREFLVSAIASGIYTLGLVALFTFIPGLREAEPLHLATGVFPLRK